MNALSKTPLIADIEAPRWYAVVSKPRAEKRAALAIMDALKTRDRAQELAVYLPCETCWARHARRKEQVTRPLFMRYLFVFIRDEHMHLVKDSDGVQDFVRSGGLPSPFPAKRLNQIRDAEEAGEFDRTRTFDGPFKAGDPVEVKLGKMSGWPGKVLGMSSERRVRVLLSMFGKEHEKELDLDQLRAA
jgi:transcription antitermination factor NusG